MKKLLILLLAVFLTPALAFAWGNHINKHDAHRGHTPPSVHSPRPTPAPSPSPSPSPVPVPPVTGNSIALENVWLTGYAALDNTPAKSPRTDLDGHTGTAGGDCTFDNPTTLAVGHVITNGVDKGDFAYGTKFYVPKLQCYFQAADTCGDGQTPQNIACHTPERGSLQLDLYVGSSLDPSVLTCEDNMTDIYSVIENPIAGLPVKTGNICN